MKTFVAVGLVLVATSGLLFGWTHWTAAELPKFGDTCVYDNGCGPAAPLCAVADELNQCTFSCRRNDCPDCPGVLCPQGWVCEGTEVRTRARIPAPAVEPDLSWGDEYETDVLSVCLPAGFLKKDPIEERRKAGPIYFNQAVLGLPHPVVESVLVLDAAEVHTGWIRDSISLTLRNPSPSASVTTMTIPLRLPAHGPNPMWRSVDEWLLSNWVKDGRPIIEVELDEGEPSVVGASRVARYATGAVYFDVAVPGGSTRKFSVHFPASAAAWTEHPRTHGSSRAFDVMTTGYASDRIGRLRYWSTASPVATAHLGEMPYTRDCKFDLRHRISIAPAGFEISRPQTGDGRGFYGVRWDVEDWSPESGWSTFLVEDAQDVTPRDAPVRGELIEWYGCADRADVVPSTRSADML